MKRLVIAICVWIVLVALTVVFCGMIENQDLSLVMSLILGSLSGYLSAKLYILMG